MEFWDWAEFEEMYRQSFQLVKNVHGENPKQEVVSDIALSLYQFHRQMEQFSGEGVYE